MNNVLASPNNEPFGGCKAIFAHLPVPWVTSASPDYDFGVLDLSCQVGNQTGYMSLFSSDGNLDTLHVALSGYPSDKPVGHQWLSLGTVGQTTPRQIFYDNDMIPGQSGSPLWDMDQCQPCVIGWNSTQYDPPTLNSGPRINQEVFNALVQWKQFVYHGVLLPLVLR